MKFTVEITTNAESEIAEIFAWIAPSAPMNALRWLEQLEATIAALSSYPRRGKRTPEADGLEGETRQIVHGEYRVIYAIQDERVLVLHVRHMARRPLHE